MGSKPLRNPAKMLGEAGFTLLETMIAMAIVVFVFASVIMVESAAISSMERTKRMTTVTMLAKQAMTKAEMEIEGKNFKEVDKEKSGHFEAPYEEYHWKRQFKEMEFPNIMAAGSGNKDDDNGESNSAVADQMGKVMTKYLSKALRELSITVYWPRGDKEQSYTVSQWMVDLNSEFDVNP